MFRVLDAVSAIDQCQVAAVFEVIREAVADSAGVKSHVGIVREEEWVSFFRADVQLDSVKGFAIEKVVVRGAAPRLVGPARVIKAGWHGMSRRSYRQEIHDHYFVEACEAMIDVPRPVRRPVPVKRVTLRRLAIPIPFHGFPEMGDALIERLLSGAGLIEILARG